MRLRSQFVKLLALVLFAAFGIAHAGTAIQSLTSPAVEPVTFILLGVGLLGLGVVSRRRPVSKAGSRTPGPPASMRRRR